MNFKRWIAAASIAAAVTALCGCTHQPSASEQFQDDMKRKFAELQDPRCSIDKMREFAMEKLTDLSDEESDYLEQHNPAITSNYEQSEYAFTWYIKSAKGGIEVLSSPPPCEPLAVFRVNHVYYP